MKKIIYAIFIFCCFPNFVFAENFVSGKITSDWGNGFCYNITINNTSSQDFSDWKINFKLPGDTKISSNWSGTFTNVGTDYLITSLDWNKKISPSGKIDIGFCGEGTSRPSDIAFSTIKQEIINISQPITIQKDGLLVVFAYQSKRDGGYCKKITLKNNGIKTISNWNIGFNSDQRLDTWSANFVKNGSNYSVSPLDWNKEILPGVSKEIGFCAMGNSLDSNHNIQSVIFNGDSGVVTPPVVIVPPIIVTPPETNTGSNSNITNILNYPVDSWTSKKVDLDADGKNDVILELNPWNIANASGKATMGVDYPNQSVIYSQDLSNISIKDAGGYVLSYPEMYVGNKPWNGQYIETKSKLPVLFSSLNDLQVKVNYKLNFETGLHSNLAMEGWFTKNKFPSSGVGQGEAELMFWLYSNGLNPAGQYVGDMNIDIKVNGVSKTEIFEIYKGNIGWEVISFRPKNGGWLQANIEVNFKQVFDKFKTLTSLTNVQNLYFQDWEIGSETGSPFTTKAKYDWKISKFDVTGILSNSGVVVIPPPISNTGSSFSGIINIPKNNIMVGYYPTRGRYTYTYDKIDYSKFDIINFAFLYPNADGTLRVPSEAVYPELINEVHKNGNKIVISIGGGTESYNFPSLVSSTTSRNKFISEVKKYIIDNNYDGVDLDWEFPNNDAEGKQFIDLLRDLKTQLGSGKIVSTAISINPNFIDIQELSKVADYIYIMAYDIEGGWNGYAGYNAPLYKNSKMPYDFSIDTFMNTKFFNNNIDKSKFILGFPLYGRKFSVSQPYMTSYYSDYVLYNELPKNCVDNWDNESKVPYLSCGSYYISYDNARSLDEKIKYSNTKSLGGVFLWAIGQDNGEIVKNINKNNQNINLSISSSNSNGDQKIVQISQKTTSKQDKLSEKIDSAIKPLSHDEKTKTLKGLISKLKKLQDKKYTTNSPQYKLISDYITILQSKL